MIPMPDRRWFVIPVCWLGLWGFAGGEDFPDFPDPHLQEGRTVWVENCKTCHGYGVAGAPIPTDAEAWGPRLQQTKDRLYEHAINGFFGPDDTMMPARGGNQALSDAQVRSAVDYMVEVAKQNFQHINEEQ